MPYVVDRTPALRDRPCPAARSGQVPDELRPVLAMLAIGAGALAVVGHHAAGLAAPLWLDESWTTAFAGLPSLSDLFREIRDDANAPGYFLAIWVWAKLFGTSDVSMHVPSLLLSLAAPVVAWTGLRRDRAVTALIWAALLGVWSPGLVLSGYARCYALLLCLAVATSIGHLRVIEEPTRRRAFVWALLGAATTLTHYDAGVLVAAQGLALLVVHRRRALALWPAAVSFVPVAACLAWHLPRLAAFARPGVAWWRELGATDIPVLAAYLLGVSPSAPILLGLLATGLAGELACRRIETQDITDANRAARIAGVTAIAAAAALIGVGFLRPMFSIRYLVPFAPGVLLLVALRLETAGRAKPVLLGTLAHAYGILSALFWLGPTPFPQRIYSFEAASAWLAEAGPARVAYFLDNPLSLAEAPRQLALMGGVFFRRAGSHPVVVPVMLEPNRDMNGAVLLAAGGEGAVLWLYDVSVHDTSASAHPPRLAALDPGLDCRDFGAAPIGVLACRRDHAALGEARVVVAPGLTVERSGAPAPRALAAQ